MPWPHCSRIRSVVNVLSAGFTLGLILWAGVAVAPASAQPQPSGEVDFEAEFRRMLASEATLGRAGENVRELRVQLAGLQARIDGFDPNRPELSDRGREAEAEFVRLLGRLGRASRDGATTRAEIAAIRRRLALDSGARQHWQGLEGVEFVNFHNHDWVEFKNGS